MAESSKRCTYTYAEPDPRAGQQCAAFATKHSFFCNIHSGDLARMQENAAKARARRQQMKDDLTHNEQSLKTVSDYGLFIEKIINGVMGGYISRDQAGMLAMFIPQGVKIAQHLEKQGKTPQVKVQVTNQQIQVMNFDQIDAFLSGDDAAAVQLLTEVQEAGTIKLSSKDKKTIDVQVVEPVKPEELKIPVKDLAKLTEKTNAPMSAPQIQDLFGTYLGDTAGQPARKANQGGDISGMSDLFLGNGSGLPIEARDRPHEWQQRHKETGVIPGLAALYWVCLGCGKEVKSTHGIFETCPTPRPPDYSKNTALITVEDDDETIDFDDTTDGGDDSASEG